MAAAASGPPQFLQHFRRTNKFPFQTLEVPITGEKGEESFVELEGVTYLIVSTGDRYWSEDAPFSLFNLETGQEIKSRFAIALQGMNWRDETIAFEWSIRRHTSVSCGNKLAVHFKSHNSHAGALDGYYFEVIYELRNKVLVELERTPMHAVLINNQVHRTIFLDDTTILFANEEGVFTKTIGNDAEPNRIHDPLNRSLNWPDEPISIIRPPRAQNGSTPDPHILLQEKNNGVFSRQYSIPLYLTNDWGELWGSLSVLLPNGNLTVLSNQCVGTAVDENQMIFVCRAGKGDLHIMKYAAETGAVLVHALGDVKFKHIDIQFDGRYIAHLNVHESAYDEEIGTDIYDLQTGARKDAGIAFGIEYEDYHTPDILCGWGLINCPNKEEIMVYPHKSSCLKMHGPDFHNYPEYYCQKNKDILYLSQGFKPNGKDAKFRIYELLRAIISPNKEYIMFHARDKDRKDRMYRVVVDLQLFYDVWSLLTAFSRYVSPLLKSGKGLEVFNTGPGRIAIDMMMSNQMPEIPDIVKRMKNYSARRNECLRLVRLPDNVSKLGMPLWKLFARILELDEYEGAAGSAAGHVSKKSRKLLNVSALKF